MTVYYKAIRPDGGSFHSPSFPWATKPGGITTHPGSSEGGAAAYLSVATVPTDCTGMSWPCRLLEVEPVGEAWTPNGVNLPNKRAALAFRTIREIPATAALGPQGEHVAALIDRARALSADEVNRLLAARDAARYAAWYAAGYAAGDAARDAAGDAAWHAAWYAAGDAAWHAARYAARYAAWHAARYAAGDAAWALVVRDLIGHTFTQAHYDALTRPWRTVIGPIHPDDEEMP